MSADSQGWKHFDRGNFKEARQAYNVAVQKNPDNPHCYHLRGQCYLMQGLYEEAMVEFSTAIKVNPRCAGRVSPSHRHASIPMPTQLTQHWCVGLTVVKGTTTGAETAIATRASWMKLWPNIARPCNLIPSLPGRAGGAVTVCLLK